MLSNIILYCCTIRAGYEIVILCDVNICFNCIHIELQTIEGKMPDFHFFDISFKCITMVTLMELSMDLLD